VFAVRSLAYNMAAYIHFETHEAKILHGLEVSYPLNNPRNNGH